MKYDAIIVGGSFAGLAVASHLRGNILIIDKKEIGAEQTSACGTVLSVLERLDCMDSVLQVYNTGFVHTASKTIEYNLPYPFCAFDYQKLCQTLVKRVEAKIIKANVQGLVDGCVMTDEGQFRGKCIIDASGWRAVLASSLESDFIDRSKLSFGIETTVNYDGEGLQFWLDPRLIKRGVGWLFPCGLQARFGVGSYLGETNLGLKLVSFLSGFRLQVAEIHGGFLPCRLRRPTVGRLFLVGDAAGQCEPFTGFGIRPALYFGLKCADIVQRVIDKEISLEEGQQHYNELVRTYHRHYAFLGGLQKLLLVLPNSWLTPFLEFLSYQPIFNFILEWHQRHTSLEEVSGIDLAPANSIEVSGNKDIEMR